MATDLLATLHQTARNQQIALYPGRIFVWLGLGWLLELDVLVLQVRSQVERLVN